MTVLALIFLSMLLQLAAAVIGLRLNRITGRSPAWALMSAALVLMAVRRLYLLVQYAQRGVPGYLLPNEILGLIISALLLGGMLLIQRVLRDMAQQATRLDDARALARDETDKLKAVMEATPVPLWIAEDIGCKVLHGNHAAAALLRMPVDANHSKSASEEERPYHFQLLHDGRELRAEEMPLQRAALEGVDIRDLPLDLVFQDGEVRHLTAYATPLRDRAGQIQGAVGCMVDLTDTRRAEAALTKAQKMESLGMLAGGLAHDFNNIFQTMSVNLEMAQAAIPSDARGQHYLQRLGTGLERATRLSRDILHSSGGDLRRPETLDLTPLITETLDRVGGAVSRDLARDLPNVLADPLLIGRVVEGLVTNAMEASDTHGTVRVRTYLRTLTPLDLSQGHWPESLEPGTFIVLEVSDQGHGIESGMLTRIFDPFFSTRDIGRGLGLAATLGIVRAHHGGVQVESIPGVGSVFRIHFPTQEGQEAAPLVPTEEARTRNLVLLADDEVDLREVMAEMLQDWFGLEVVAAADGQEALDAFTQRPQDFDLVILDATMPRLGGVAAFTAMRAIRPGIPGILCSGYAMPVSRDQAIAQGFTDFLKKPFSSAELEALLDRVMGVRLK